MQTELIEALEKMRDVAKMRIGMIKQGLTFHDSQRKTYYLHEYEEKLHSIEGILRRNAIHLVKRDTNEVQPD